MKKSLQISLNQQLKLSHQLQQSIKLLQFSTLELQQEIQQQLEFNPMLEIAANEDIQEESSFQDDEDTDFQWSHLYSTDNTSKQFNQNDYIYETQHCTSMDLKEHLRWQLNLTPMSERDQLIAFTFIDALDDNGLLTLSLEEIYQDLSISCPKLTHEECDAVRHRLQRFDPVGCCSTHLAETLLVQLEQLPESTPYLDLAKTLIRDDIQLLGKRDHTTLKKRYHIDEQTLSKLLNLIKHLNPTPGSSIQKGSTEYIIPDLIVHKINGRWAVSLNSTALPQLNINQYYAAMAKQAKCFSEDNPTDYAYLRNHLQDARHFLKNIQNRQDTLLKVANYIIQFQQLFFDVGEQAMKPLVLHDVAQALGFHPSTISRVTTHKFIQTPRGLLELKFFFTVPLPSNKGLECSALSIRAKIKKLIHEEDSKNPLSDIKIAEQLSQQGIHVARRTITKYRELMGISSSNMRKC